MFNYVRLPINPDVNFLGRRMKTVEACIVSTKSIDKYFLVYALHKIIRVQSFTFIDEYNFAETQNADELEEQNYVHFYFYELQ